MLKNQEARDYKQVSLNTVFKLSDVQDVNRQPNWQKLNNTLKNNFMDFYWA